MKYSRIGCCTSKLSFDSLQGRDNQNDNPMLEMTTDIMNHLRDHSQQISTGQPMRPSSGGDEVVDNETYLIQMGINRNWEIPRERLEITEDELGGGEFGVVRKGIYLRTNGQKLPVAVKMLKGQMQSKTLW